MKHEYLETSVWFKDKITDPIKSSPPSLMPRISRIIGKSVKTSSRWPAPIGAGKSRSRVFKRFFRFQEITNWKEQLQLLMDYSLRSMNLLELEDIRPLSLYFQLTKLVEAAHLIDVREVNHVGGHVKNRISKRRL